MTLMFISSEILLQRHDNPEIPCGRIQPWQPHIFMALGVDITVSIGVICRVFAPKVKGLPSNVTSLFESYSLAKVECWKPNKFGNIMSEKQDEEREAVEKSSVDLVKDEREENKDWIKQIDNMDPNYPKNEEDNQNPVKVSLFDT